MFNSLNTRKGWTVHSPINKEMVQRVLQVKGLDRQGQKTGKTDMHRTNLVFGLNLMCNTQHTMRPAQVPETHASFLWKQIHGSKVRTKDWAKTNKLWMKKWKRNWLW